MCMYDGLLVFEVVGQFATISSSLPHLRAAHLTLDEHYLSMLVGDHVSTPLYVMMAGAHAWYMCTVYMVSGLGSYPSTNTGILVYCDIRFSNSAFS
jgi:hypothetical protein